jgi:hypothetical protein
VNWPGAGASGGAGFQAASRDRYEFGWRCRSPTRTSATIRPPTGPSRSASWGVPGGQSDVLAAEGVADGQVDGRVRGRDDGPGEGGQLHANADGVVELPLR